MVVKNQICFNFTNFFISFGLFFIIIVGIIIVLAFLYKNETSKLYNDLLQKSIDIKNTLSKNASDIFKQKEYEVPNTRVNIETRDSRNIYPEKRYVGPLDYTNKSQQVGFIYDGTGNRFPLYEERLDNKYYYHIIDDTRNNIRIAIENPKNEQFSDEQTISIPELGGVYTIKLYEYSGNRYNPFVY